MKLNRNYLKSLILEMMEEDLLYEGWDSNWPSHFEELKLDIKGWTTKGKKTEQILSKYALEVIPFDFLSVEGIWNKYRRLIRNFSRNYFQSGKGRSKDDAAADKMINSEGGFMRLMLVEFQSKFYDATTEKGAMAALQVLNKMVSKLDKRIAEFWESVDASEDWPLKFQKEVSKALRELQFQEARNTDRDLIEIIQFVNMDKSDDNTKKLAAFYKKIKPEGANYLWNIRETKKWIKEQLFAIDMTPCEDDSADWDAPCVLHKFDDGYFWYDIKASQCKISGEELNNCGQASMEGSGLYNLMSHSETGKPNWHIMVEYNVGEKAIIQVMGNSNSVPKEEYWSHIQWLYEKFKKPIISNYAWEHVQGDDIKDKVYKFLQFLGIKSDMPMTETWSQLKGQIDDGFYNVKSYEEEFHGAVDFSKMKFIAHENHIDMSMRTRKGLLRVGSGEGESTYEDVRDYKAAARGLNNSDKLYNLLEKIIPDDWVGLFDPEDMTQRVRFSHSGKMMLYFNWTTKKLQDLDGGMGDDADYSNKLQREDLAQFMLDTQRAFNVDAMSAVTEHMGNELESNADELLMNRGGYDRGDDLDEESQKILSELLKVSKPKKD